MKASTLIVVLVFLLFPVLLCLGDGTDGPADLIWSSSCTEAVPVESDTIIRDARIDADGNIFVLRNISRQVSPYVYDLPLAAVSDVAILKLNSDGEEEWATRITSTTNEVGHALLIDSAGDLYVIGWAEKEGAAATNELLMYKITAEGDLRWRKTVEMTDGKEFPSGGFTLIRSTMDGDDNLYVVAEVATRPAGETGRGNRGSWPRDILFMKLDSEGEVVWQEDLGTPESDYCFDIAISEDNELYLVGATMGELFGEVVGGVDGFVAKYDSEGVQLWAKQMGTSGGDLIESVGIGDDGRIYAVGSSTGEMADDVVGGEDILLMELDAAGDVLWRRQFGTSADDRASFLALDSSGDLYFVGQTQGDMGGTNAGETDIFIGKYDDQGEEIWVAQVGDSEIDFPKGLRERQGFLYVLGYSGSGLFDGDLAAGTFLLKYQAGGGE
jgi:hypothetical protein